MPIDPKVREALEQLGIDSVRAILILYYTGSGTGAAITLGPGFYANRSDAEEWLREKDKQRARRERSDRRWLRINTIAAILGARRRYGRRRVGVSRMGRAMISAVDLLAWHPRVRRRAEAARIQPEKPARVHDQGRRAPHLGPRRRLRWTLSRRR